MTGLGTPAIRRTFAGLVVVLAATACEVPPPLDVASRLCAPWEPQSEQVARRALFARSPLPHLNGLSAARVVTLRRDGDRFVVSVDDPTAFAAETGLTAGPQLDIVRARAGYAELLSIALAIGAEMGDAFPPTKADSRRPRDYERPSVTVSDGFVQVALLAGMEGFAQQLRDRYGDKVSISVGAWLSGGGPETRPGPCLLTAPLRLADSGTRNGIRIELQLQPGIDAAFSIGGVARVTNRLGSSVSVGEMQAFLVRRGTDQVVGGRGLAQAYLADSGPPEVADGRLVVDEFTRILWPAVEFRPTEVPRGGSTSRSVVVATANVTSVPQAALLPGRYDAIAVAEIDGRRYRSARVPVTLGAPHPFG